MKKGTSDPSRAANSSRRVWLNPNVQSWLSAMSTAAASLLPPPSPPCAGISLRNSSAAPCVRYLSSRNKRAARTARLSSLRRLGTSTAQVMRSSEAISMRNVSLSEIVCMTDESAWYPSSRFPRTESVRMILAHAGTNMAGALTGPPRWYMFASSLAYDGQRYYTRDTRVLRRERIVRRYVVYHIGQRDAYQRTGSAGWRGDRVARGRPLAQKDPRKPVWRAGSVYCAH